MEFDSSDCTTIAEEKNQLAQKKARRPRRTAFLFRFAAPRRI
jgi:hypothetical protein